MPYPTQITPLDAISRTNETRSVLGSKIAWFVVIGAALALSWWSLSYIAIHAYGVPKVLAWVISCIFDGGALLTGDMSLEAAQNDESGLAPRTAMLLLTGISAWLNWEHGALQHYGAPGKLLFAAPPVTAGILAHLWTAGQRRAARRATGRIAPALPPFGFLVIALHPGKVLSRVRRITLSRLESIPTTILDWPQDEHEHQDEAAPQEPPQQSGPPATEEELPSRRIPVESFMPAARRLAVVEGAVPSTNQLMARLKVGRPRARELHKRLTEEAARGPRRGSVGDGLGEALSLLTG